MKIFYAALIILVAVILFTLPVTEAVYNFRTDVHTDTFTITTGAGVTTGNATLSHLIFDDDTGTVTFSSNTSESIAVAGWNNSTKKLDMSGLTASTTRAVAVSYDTSAFTRNTATDTLLGHTPLIWYLLIICLPIAAIMSIFWGRN